MSYSYSLLGYHYSHQCFNLHFRGSSIASKSRIKKIGNDKSFDEIMVEDPFSSLIGHRGTATTRTSNQSNFGNSSNNNILSAMRPNFTGSLMRFFVFTTNEQTGPNKQFGILSIFKYRTFSIEYALDFCFQILLLDISCINKHAKSY